MIFALAIAGIFLILIGALNWEKLRVYSLLTALACAVFSIELITNWDGLTLGFLILLTALQLPSIKITFCDMIGCLIISLPCAFWLNTQEFVDGFAYSYVLVALGVAIIGNLIFDKQKRQTLCALVLLTSFVISFLSDLHVFAIDIVLSFLTTVVFTQFYQKTNTTTPQNTILSR